MAPFGGVQALDEDPPHRPCRPERLLRRHELALDHGRRGNRYDSGIDPVPVRSEILHRRDNPDGDGREVKYSLTAD